MPHATRFTAQSRRESLVRYSRPGMRIVVDDQPIDYFDGDSVAVAIIRAGQHPQHGGTLCLAGDCGNCCAEIDGVAFTRTCLTPARPVCVCSVTRPLALPHCTSIRRSIRLRRRTTPRRRCADNTPIWS